MRPTVAKPDLVTGVAPLMDVKISLENDCFLFNGKVPFTTLTLAPLSINK
jgi:hypothetical protein